MTKPEIVINLLRNRNCYNCYYLIPPYERECILRRKKIKKNKVDNRNILEKHKSKRIFFNLPKERTCEEWEGPLTHQEILEELERLEELRKQNEKK